MWPRVTEDPLSLNLCFLHEGHVIVFCFPCFVFLLIFPIMFSSGHC